MDSIKNFFAMIEKAETAILATSEDGNVTERCISPVNYDGKILFFTFPDSVKYHQLKANPHCSITTGMYFAQADAELCGSTMLPENENLRNVYCKRWPGAFDENVEFGGRGADFVILTPTKLKGWNYAKDGDPIPTIPFETDF